MRRYDKDSPLKLLVAILITFILILPEYFKTPKGNTLKLSCQEVCLQPNFTFLLSSLNFSFMTLLQPIREAQTVMGIFLNHSNFPNFTMVCEGITSDFQKPSSCLVCESKGNMDFISLKQTSKVLIMRRAMEVEANDCHSPCQHYNFTVAPIIGHLEEYIATCTLKTHARKSAVTEEDLTKEKPINHTCRILEDPNKCINISLHLEMDVKHFTCSMKITWYILVLSVFIVMIILIIYKILEGHRKVWKWKIQFNSFWSTYCVRDHAEATLGSGRGSTSSNTRTRSLFRSASRTVCTIIPLNSSGQFGLNPFEEYS